MKSFFPNSPYILWVIVFISYFLLDVEGNVFVVQNDNANCEAKLKSKISEKSVLPRYAAGRYALLE